MSQQGPPSPTGSRTSSQNQEDEVSLGCDSDHGTVASPRVDRRSPSPVLPLDPTHVGGFKRGRGDDDDGAKVGKKPKREKKIEMAEAFGKALRDLVADGLTSGELKEIKERYAPNFLGKAFTLNAPSMDNSVYQRLMLVRKSSASKGTIDPVEKTLFNLQQMALDLIRPILALQSEDGLSDDGRAAIGDFFSLWGNIVGEFSKYRRHNIIRQTHPTYKYLVDDKNNFSRREQGDLFGRTFIRSMVQTADDEKKLGAIPSGSTSSDRRQGGGGSYYKGGNNSRESSGGRGHHHSQQSANFVQPDGSHAGSSSDNRSNFNNRGGYVVSTPSPIPFGGRLSYFVSAWESLTSDPWVLGVIREGLRVDLISRPVQWAPRPMVFSSDQMSICDKEVSELLKKGAIELPPSGDDGFVSTIFVVPKPSGGFRPVINLKPLNRHVVYRHFKMEGMETVRDLLRQGDFMAKIDLKDAFLSVPVHPDDRCLLRFKWRDVLYGFSAMPFGLSSAPWAFTKLMKPILGFLRERGIRLVIYLDDILLMNQSAERLKEEIILVVDLLESLGFVINKEKSDFVPKQKVVFLGYMINSVDMALGLPSEKRDSIGALAKRILSGRRTTLRDLASLLGKLSWASAAVLNARSRLRSIQSFYISGCSRADGQLQTKVELSPDVRCELSWWISNLPSLGGKPLLDGIPSLIISSDACLTGWGAVCEAVTTGGEWSADELRKYRHINELELLAAFNGLQAFAAHRRGMTIRLEMDNTTAVSYVNRQGGSRSGLLSALAVAIIRWGEDRELAIESVYLPGELNFVADKESRRGRDWSDWRLCSKVFSIVSKRWTVEIDLFSMPWNAQLTNFVCWLPQPGAIATDAMSISWTRLRGYAFPPFGLIGGCLSKVRSDQARLVLITPYWPSQPWFPVAMQLAVDVPVILPSHPNLLTSGREEMHPLCSRQSFRLIAWLLSGRDSETEAFRKKWSTYSWPVAAVPPSRPISQPGSLGVLGVLDAVKIPCMLA